MEFVDNSYFLWRAFCLGSLAGLSATGIMGRLWKNRRLILYVCRVGIDVVTDTKPRPGSVGIWSLPAISGNFALRLRAFDAGV